MRIYYYCSYDNSPAGFHLNKIDFPSALRLDSTDEIEKVDTFIQNCFESGLIRSGFGRVPHCKNKCYFFLRKKLNGERNGEKWYLNLATVSDQREEFERLMDVNGSEEKAVSTLLNSVILDKTNEFGYRVVGEKLNAVVNGAYGSLCECHPHWLERVEKSGGFFATLSTNSPQFSTLTSQLGIASEQDYSFKPINVSKKLFYYGKGSSNDEKNSSAGRDKPRAPLSAPTVGLLTLVVILVIIALVLLSSSNQPPASQPATQLTSQIQ